jgi:hypothetical protein
VFVEFIMDHPGPGDDLHVGYVDLFDGVPGGKVQHNSSPYRQTPAGFPAASAPGYHGYFVFRGQAQGGRHFCGGAGKHYGIGHIVVEPGHEGTVVVVNPSLQFPRDYSVSRKNLSELSSQPVTVHLQSPRQRLN